MTAIDKLTEDLTQKLVQAYRTRLVSVVLYGSAAVGDHSRRFSDINVLCVLDRVTPAELMAAEPIFRWWRARENPAPLLFTEEEVRNSTDCFPIEFHDIKESCRILHGKDLFSDLDIDDSFYRAQVEYQLRAKLLRLRQKSAGVLHDNELLLKLLADSVSTFCVLTRHALRLHGVEAAMAKKDIVAQAADNFQIDPTPFLRLLDLRDGEAKKKDLDPVPLYKQYLDQIIIVTHAVDRLEK